MKTLSNVLLACVLFSCLMLCGGAGPAAKKGEKDVSVVRSAIEWVESKDKKDAHNKAEDALGILQIRPIMVTEVNRICGRTAYTNEDRRDVGKSRAMFLIYTRYWSNYYKDWSDEGIARRWNGGTDGHKQASSAGYWRKVKDAIKRKK